jgi:predicted lipoprotein with Yx(FWY)xxD motif
MTERTSTNQRTVRPWHVALLASTASLAIAASIMAGTTAAAGVAASPGVVHAKKQLLETEKTPVGTILVDKKGRTVYVFMADKKGVSNCTGQCLQYWPAVVAPAKLPASLPGVTGKLGVIVRKDNGTRQLTMNGWPLYLYAGDTKPGMIAGQGSNGGGALWWVVGPNGKKITKVVPSPSASASASASPSGSEVETESPSASPTPSHT